MGLLTFDAPHDVGPRSACPVGRHTPRAPSPTPYRDRTVSAGTARWCRRSPTGHTVISGRAARSARADQARPSGVRTSPARTETGCTR